MANLSGFDANGIEPATTFEALPAGDYTAIIVESDYELTANAKASGNAQDGQFLKLKLQVVEGPFQNRTLYDRLNLVNPNEQAVEIAKRTLSAICRAVGRMQPQDSSELHNIPMIVKVGQEPYNGSMSNKVKGYKSTKPAEEPEAPVAATARPSPQPATAKAGNGKNKAPWAR